MRVVLLFALIALASAGQSQFHAGTSEFNRNPAVCKSRASAKYPLRSVSHAAGDSIVLSNGVLRLGVYGPGSLNADGPASANSGGFVGIRYIDHGVVEADATAPACLCEGFGASARWTDTYATEGFANRASGFSNIVWDTPVTVGSGLSAGADTSATIGPDAAHLIGITHQFRVSPATPNAYEVTITLTNKHTTLSMNRLRYSRVMDWDIYPTTFAECVDVNIGTAVDIPCAHDNGFVTGGPDSSFPGGILFGLGSCADGSRSRNNSGPSDHGSAFLIELHDVTAATPLAPGQSKSFKMFYGAADNRANALSVLGAIHAEAYSFGYPNVGGSCDNDGAPNTYIWAFAGVGGTVIVPSDDCSGADCAHTTACPGAATASASSTSSNCASISFDVSAC